MRSSSKNECKIFTNEKLIEIKGNKLTNTDININIPSAQIKSGVIFAAINTLGLTKLWNFVTRNHAEIMLSSFGADLEIINDGSKTIIKINGCKELKSKNIDVPSDLSSCAFFIVATLINKNSNIILRNINVNPTRNGILIALEKMGAKISYFNKRKSNNENVCDIEVFSSELNGCELDSSIAKLMIDEYPILSIAASFAKSPSIFRGLSELRVKESDRLSLIDLNLKRCGIESKVIGDDLYINPIDNNVKSNITIKTDFDHRIAMSFAVMGSKLGPIKIEEANSINTSFPSFINEYNNIGGQITWKI